jgi:protein-export membrane protein SecD/preprotein translocase SecF subunit
VTTTTTPRPGRTLLVFALLLAAVFGGVAAAGSWTPNLGLDLQGGTSITLTAEQVDGAAPTEESLAEAVSIIRQRVDGSGVAEAEVTTQGTDTIIVQVPGVGEDELVALVGQTAQLEFRPVLLTVPGGAPAPTPEESPDASPEASPDASPEASPDASPEAERERARDRADRGAARAELVAPPAGLPAQESPSPTDEPAPTDEPDPTEPTVPATPTDEQIQELLAFDCRTLEPGDTGSPEEPLVTCDRTGSARYLLGPVAVAGTEVSEAFAGIPQGGVNWQVSLDFTGAGADAWFETTSALTTLPPPQNQIAIVLDGLVVSAPVVQSAIPDGQTSITGDFTQEEAENLANVLQFGALPLSFEVSEVTSVSPTLGADQLRAGLIAGAIGLVLVMLYSLVYYRGLGLVVIASLLAAGTLTYGLVTLLSATIGFTLTLAGVAGLIVAIGITADSFVVLFERIRDEVREGRSVRMAVETGWVRARRTIIASDIVSLLAAFFLYIFSVGSVRGFAFTLGLTTLVDLLVVFLFTKPMLSLLVRTQAFAQGRPWTGLDAARLGRSGAAALGGLAGLGNRLYRGETSIEFVGRSRRWYAISAGLLGVAVLGLVLRGGLTLGIEFTGGAEFSAQADTVSASTIADVRDAVTESGAAGAADPRVTVVGDDRVRVQTGVLSAAETAEVRDAMAETLDIASDEVTVQTVGPSWGAEITQKALQGLLFFLLAVVVYLAVAFEWKMGVAAIAALAHDVVITVGIYAFSGFDVTPASVIGFLTILGYSLYDTVVVFDKVRENTKGITGQSRITYSEAANLAVNQTLIRSINTSVIALLPIASILVVSIVVLGTGTLKDLALALFVGVAVGTYSSIFIATPLLADLKEREPVIRALRQRVLLRRAGGRTADEPVGAAVAASTSALAAESIGQRGGSVIETGQRVQPSKSTRAQRRKQGRGR